MSEPDEGGIPEDPAASGPSQTDSESADQASLPQEGSPGPASHKPSGEDEEDQQTYSVINQETCGTPTARTICGPSVGPMSGPPG